MTLKRLIKKNKLPLNNTRYIFIQSITLRGNHSLSLMHDNVVDILCGYALCLNKGNISYLCFIFIVYLMYLSINR